MTGEQSSNDAVTNIKIDFGGGYDSIESQRLEDLTFTSMVDAANYLSKYSWTLVEACAPVKHHYHLEYHWIFKKEVSEDEFNKATYYL